MLFVRCVKCTGTIGALNFSSLHSEMSWREWAVVKEADESFAVYCPRCVEAHKPEHRLKGSALAVQGDVLRTLVESCDG